MATVIIMTIIKAITTVTTMAIAMGRPRSDPHSPLLRFSI